jgi:hypothetical protein
VSVGDTLRNKKQGSVAVSAVAMLIVYVVMTFVVSATVATALAFAFSALHII